MNQAPLAQTPLFNREVFDRILAELKSRHDDTRQRATHDLRQTLEAVQRDFSSPDSFQEAYRYVFTKSSQSIVQGSDTAERIGGVYALGTLIDFKSDDIAQKTTRFSNALRTILRGTDTAAMIVAARALGRLATPGNPLTAELVDSEVKAALESLQAERQENRRFAAVLTLRELANNAPTLLYQYVSQILEVIWVALRDPKVLIRESTAEALRTIIEIIGARDPLFREQWFTRIYQEIGRGFQLGSVESIHGSLLGLKELLNKGGMFMQGGTKYQDACDRVFLYKEHREPLIRREVTVIIPILAAYYPAEFSNSYLHKFMIHLQGQLKKEKDRNPAFVAIGDVANAVQSAIDPYLDSIMVYLRQGLSEKAQNKSINDAPIFKCISMIAIAVGQTMTKYMDALLDPIFACGLSDALTQALVDMAHFIPPATQRIQEKLLDSLSYILCGHPFQPPGSPAHPIKPTNYPREHRDQYQVKHSEAEIALALQTLGSFDFSGYILNEFVHDVALRYVDHDNAIIRRAAALTCCQLYVKDPIIHQVSRHAVQVVGNVIEKLLAVCVADPDPDIRHEVLVSLDPRFDRHLAKAENIRSLFLAFNDEHFANREAAMTIVGRLSTFNPAYVFPSLRKVLIQLLTEIEYSNLPRNKQESCQLISHLVASSSGLIRPYVDAIVHVLLPKANDPDEAVSATALAAIGDLANIGGEGMTEYIPQLMPIIMQDLQNLGSNPKRSAALRTLAQLGSNSGYVIDPYIEHPELLTILTNNVKVEPVGPLRGETARLIGILGALDPYKHQQALEDSPEHTLVAEAQAVTDVSLIMTGITPSNEDFYPTVVITTLMNVLKDNSLAQYYPNVIDAVMNIYTTMGLKCVSFLNVVIPGFLQVIKNTSPGREEGYFNQLALLVRTVRQHIRPYLPQIIEVIQDFWPRASGHATMLSLIEAIARCLEGEFKIYLARLLPLMLGVLDDERNIKKASAERVLHAFLVFGSSAEEYMHLIIPVVIRMFERQSLPHSLRRQAIETLGRISKRVNISDFAARIIHPLTRILAGNDSALRQTALETLCALIFQLGPDYIQFIPTVNKVLAMHRIAHSNYSLIVLKLQRGEPLPQDLSPDEHYRDVDEEQRPADIQQKLLAVNQQHLKNAWDTGNRTTREDWQEWMRRLSIELLKESPQQSLRACFPLASVHLPTAKILFNSAFISCYTQLFPQYQGELVRAIEVALTSPNIPPEILQVLLNLAEFMEHDDKPLPIDVRTLGQYAAKCHAYAKALHYKELEFNAEQSREAVEALISINNQLQQSDAAFGILKKAQSYQNVDLKETWFEKLNKWDEALASYQKREAEEPYSFEVTMGKMRCLHALGEWDVLSTLAEDKWARAATEGHQRFIAPLAAAASWGLGQWELMDRYLGAMKPDSPDRSFFGAILSIHRNQYADAQLHISKARDGLDTELTALLGESYTRAYSVIVRVQMLAELEEIITYKQNDKNPTKQETMRNTWTKRLKGCQRNVEVWQRMLKVRALVIKPEENMEMWIKFSSLCRKSQRFGLAEKALRSLVRTGEDLWEIPLHGTAPYAVNYAILKFMWSAPSGDREGALNQLKQFTMRLTDDIQRKARDASAELSPHTNGVNGSNGVNSLDGSALLNGTSNEPSSTKQIMEWQKLLARSHLKQGQWQIALQRGEWFHDHADEVLESYAAATKYDPQWHKAWHAWALANFEVANSMAPNANVNNMQQHTAVLPHSVVVDHVVPAIQGFFKSIALTSKSTLQDTLRILTLWFAHGGHSGVNAAVMEGIAGVSVDTWLEVIPQLIARISQPNERVRHAIHNLLCEVGRAHPQALVYPLTVSIKSDTENRSRSAAAIMENMRQHSPKLVEHADLVSHELIRLAVSWHELWHEAIEKASTLYFGLKDPDGMLACLAPLHHQLDQGAETLREVSFIQTFGRNLHEAREWTRSWKRTHEDGEMNQAWDIYYDVFKKLARQLQNVNTLELQYTAPRLDKVRDLDVAVPGTYQSGKPIVRITSFDPIATVISSKQRPRRITLKGSDGTTYAYLLKGHEDTRQDERCMQFFGLCNTLLTNDPECLKRHLNIQGFAVIPLSTKAGLLGWVPNSDTLHMLIKEYRDSRKILINIEQRIMMQMAPDYDSLTLMQKVEVFSYAMDNTTGQDLYRVLWLKSKSSEAWLDRRTNYVRSLGTMSMVGYILGLGDRHPSNLMLDRVTGKIIHIDFGDCFEIAMHREKYPERVPFRLTRMITFAMEVSNIEGSFRTTCENVMRVIRDNKESLMAVLEAFIHDPLLTWNLLDNREKDFENEYPSERRASLMGLGPPGASGNMPNIPPHPAITGSLSSRPRPRSSTTGRRPTITAVVNGGTGLPNGGDADGREDPEQEKEVQNARALEVLMRVKEKLFGRDFKPTQELGVEEQVEKLIHEATNLENLCQHYIGWCSFW